MKLIFFYVINNHNQLKKFKKIFIKNLINFLKLRKYFIITTSNLWLNSIGLKYLQLQLHLNYLSNLKNL